MEPKHPWQAKLSVATIMLVLAFLGMVITDIRITGGWDYWKWIVPVYAVLALWLSWYVQRKTQTIAPFTITHELLHWAGLIGAVFLVSLYVDLGVMSRYAAGLFDLTLLSLGVFLAGVYIEKTFLFVGIVLWVLALVSAYFTIYLFAFMIPILIGASLIIALTVWLSHKNFTKKAP